MRFQIVNISQLAKASGVSHQTINRRCTEGMFHGKHADKDRDGKGPVSVKVFELNEVMWWFKKLGWNVDSKPWVYPHKSKEKML